MECSKMEDFSIADEFAREQEEYDKSDNPNNYCCEKKCLKQPFWQVSGIACNKCESYSYCSCKCITYWKNKADRLKLEKEKYLLEIKKLKLEIKLKNRRKFQNE